MQKNALVLVTGATGFIGSRLVRELVEQDHSVVALCRSQKLPPPPPGSAESSHPLQHPSVKLAIGDITNPSSLDDAMRDVNYVFHMAGCAQQWAKDREVFQRVNVQGMRNVLNAADRCGVQRIVATSTIVTLGPTNPGQIGNETMPHNSGAALTLYEESKAQGEQVALQAAKSGTPVVIVNPTRVFGPGYLNTSNAVTDLIDKYRRNRFPVLLNQGVNIGNYVFVDDVVQGHLLAMTNGQIGRRYILGGENLSLLELYQLVDEITGCQHRKIAMLRFPKFVAWCYQMRAQCLGIPPVITPSWLNTFLVDWAFESERAKQELGYKPRSARQGIEQTLRWWQSIHDAS